MADGKIVVDVLVTDEEMKRVEKIVELLKEAKTLAGELTSIELVKKD